MEAGNLLDQLYDGNPELEEDVKEQLLNDQNIREIENQLLQRAAEQEQLQQQQQQPQQPAQTSTAQPDQQAPPTGEAESPTLMDRVDQQAQSNVETAELLLSPFAGLADWGVGVLNKISPNGRNHEAFPSMVNEDGSLKQLPKFQTDSAQAVRDISSVVIPTIWLTAKFKGLGGLAHKKVGWSLGNDAAFKWFATTGLAAGAGVAVDETAPIQERDHNAAAMLKSTWPVTWGWIPDNWATLDADSPDIKRQKNRNEGLAVGIFSDVLLGAGKLFRNLKKVRQATQWVPENEKAKNFVKTLEPEKLDKDDLANEVLNSAKKREDDLNELGQFNDSRNADPTQPVFGKHDIYDPEESGLRAADRGGITSAGVDAVRVEKNIDTVHGRVGSVFSESALKEGLETDAAGRKLIKGLSKQLNDTKVGWKGSNGQYVSHKQVMQTGDKLAADLMDMDVSDMKKVLSKLSGIDTDTGARVLKSEAYAGVFKAIRNYMEEFASLKEGRAKGIVGTSLAGQVSDMAEGARLLDGTNTLARAQEQILDRLEYLMTIKGQTSYARGRALNMLNLWNRASKKTVNSTDALAAIKTEKNATLKALERIASDSKNTMDTLRAVKAERPDMLGPLMLAYEHTDGKVATISALNNYVRNSTGVIRKAVVDNAPEMPSAWMQGAWSNIYNSVLSSVGTPLKAGLSNFVLMVERPIATFAGALIHKDMATLRKASFMYTGMGDTLQKAYSHMNQVYKRAARDPNSVGYIMRDDIARKNEDQITLLRSFGDAAEKEGNFGPSALVNQIEAMNDLAEHPLLRFSANAMTAFDGFTRSFIANIEARGRAYDLFTNAGEAIQETNLKKISDGVYDEMFNSQGFINDDAVEYASREIAMNLDNKAVDALSVFIKKVPALKPFLMFPKTTMNLLAFSGSHSPIGVFWNEVNAFKLPFEQMDQLEVEKLLSSRGIPLDDNMVSAYSTIRAELKGRKAIGTLSVLGAVALFTSDRITGNGIYDKTRQKTRRELGWTPRSYKGWDGKWYSYEGLGAISDWLALTTDVMDNFDTLDEPSLETHLNKMGFLLSANLTNKSFTAGLEPLNDVLAGNPAALSRWGASFTSALAPGSGFRNEFARLMTPQLKEVEQDFFQLLANRNPITKGGLEDAHDWMDGGLIREPLNFATRVWNTYSPVWKISDKISPEKQFLIDIEWNGRPSLSTNGKGVEYSNAERSQITELLGKDKVFAEEVRRIMRSTDGKKFRDAYKNARDKGVYLNREDFDNVHYLLDRALSNAQRWAESRIGHREQVRQKEFIDKQTKNKSRKGDVEGILQLTNYYNNQILP